MHWRSIGHSKLLGKSNFANWSEFQYMRSEFIPLAAYAFHQIEIF